MDKEYLREMAEIVSQKLPDNHGFILLAFDFGVPTESSRLVYTSNANRSDAINVMKEFLIKAGHEEDWMRHIF